MSGMGSRDSAHLEPGWVRAAVLAILVHIVFFAFLIFGLNWKTHPPEGMMVDLWSNLPQPPLRPTVKAPPPSPKPTVRPPTKPPLPPSQPQIAQSEVEKPTPVEKKPIEIKQAADKEIRARKEKEDKEKAQKEQERKELEQKEQERKEQERKEQERKEQERKEQERKEQERKEQERKEQERKEQERKEQERKEQERKEQERKEQEQKARIAAELEELQREHEAHNKLQQMTAAQSRVKDEIAEYKAKILAKIKRHIVSPPDLPGDPVAEFDVTLLPDGGILQVKLRKSSGYPSFDSAVERGILLAKPLPLPPDPTLFSNFRNLRVKVHYRE